jgi:hypothetical protein
MQKKYIKINGDNGWWEWLLATILDTDIVIILSCSQEIIILEAA